MPATNLFYAPGAGLHEDEDQLRVGVGQPAVELQRKLLLRCISLHPAANSWLLFLLLQWLYPQLSAYSKGQGPVPNCLPFTLHAFAFL